MTLTKKATEIYLEGEKMISPASINPPFKIKPIPIVLLKKCFIKALYDAILRQQRLDYAKLLRVDIAPYFEMKVLPDEDYHQGIKALEELKRDGYIKPSDLNKDVYLLTEKGNKVARLQIREMRLPAIDIWDLITKPPLMFKTHTEYISGAYESAISNALKLLEVSIRSKAKLPNSAYGSGLIKSAFSAEKGVLIYPKATTPKELLSFINILDGVLGIIRNPSGHRFVDYDDPNEVIRILGFIQYLLEQVDLCYLKESKKD